MKYDEQQYIRRISIITGSRADYGLLRPLMEEIRNDPKLLLQLVVTGMHLSHEYGLTYQDIENDGFNIDEKLEILLSSDTSGGISKAMGLSMIGFTSVFNRLKPDIVVVLGDRFEIFCAVVSAYINKIPVAHISGGEVTSGAFDDGFRHSITKMSNIHLTSCETYRKRVIQLGENPDSVFNVGALGIDNISNLILLSKEELESKINFKFDERNLLVTFHPVTLDDDTEEQFNNLLDTLHELQRTKIIFTKSNADPGGLMINRLIDDYVSKNSHRAVSFFSMGQLKYLSTLQYVDAVVGNSSSGIVEAPSFRIGTINIGARQCGRIKAESIIDCEPAKESIKKALEKLYSTKFQNKIKSVNNPYGDGNSAKTIHQIIRNYKLQGTTRKDFYDIVFNIIERKNG